METRENFKNERPKRFKEKNLAVRTAILAHQKPCWTENSGLPDMFPSHKCFLYFNQVRTRNVLTQGTLPLLFLSLPRPSAAVASVQPTQPRYKTFVFLLSRVITSPYLTLDASASASIGVMHTVPRRPRRRSFIHIKSTRISFGDISY